MPKFRKRPVVIEAREFTGDPDPSLEAWMGDAFETWLPSTRQFAVRTLEGEHIVSAGDMVIRGVKGEFYGCKPDVFAQTYEAVDA
jgi:membrane-anchored protein YejM (alkaline phosphatase superfamily)